MHGAVYQPWAKMAYFLAEHGADVKVWDSKNKWGWSPLIIAYGYRPGNFRPQPDTIGDRKDHARRGRHATGQAGARQRPQSLLTIPRAMVRALRPRAARLGESCVEYVKTRTLGVVGKMRGC